MSWFLLFETITSVRVYFFIVKRYARCTFFIGMDYPIKVGIGILVFREGKVLLGQRKSSHGDGEYGGLGGHQEHGESFEACARREAREEAGIEIDNLRFLSLMNLKTYLPKHYIDIGLVADWTSNEPQTLEPHKCSGWDWYDLDDLPSPLFGPMPAYFEAYRTGRMYFDS